MTRIALISTPWPLFNRPSVQLGALKAFLRYRLPQIPVDSHHIYLSIAERLGFDLYGKVSERTWLAESLYAGLLYPDRIKKIERFWTKRAAGILVAEKHRYEELCDRLRKVSSQLLDGQNWNCYLLAGFSICFGQLTSSLYFIREIKKRAPRLKIVVGGSACAGDMGESLLQSFKDIDFVVRGEGELALLKLAKSLTDPQRVVAGAAIPGLISRHEEVEPEGIWQIPNLDELPIPDYSDYFRQLQSMASAKRFLPKLPMEISRGCWWQKRIRCSDSSGCAFCNLNLQWQGYRAKSNDRILREIETLSSKYEILSLSFMDNLLPVKGLDSLFNRIEKLGRDFRLFSEIRATTSHALLAAMGAAGMREVQVGIEALSSRLLNKLNKGTTALDNVEIMRNCEIPGFPNLTGNLILNFPSSDEQDVAETLENLDFVFPFRPLKGIPFWLGYGSAVFRMPAAYGIKRVRNHPFYRYLFPQEVLRGLLLMIQGYHGGIRYQNRIWKSVKEKLEDWKRLYSELHRAPGCEPILSYQDGGDFMIIRQRRLGTHPMTHRLTGTSRRIYLFCQTQRSMREILSHFPGFGEEKVAPFLRLMVDKRLMFSEGDRYLSLSVPIRAALHSSFR